MPFIALLFVTALMMEAVGSFVSVVGLSDFFAGDKVILLMGVILDIAKLVSVSFLYQAWDKVAATMKAYMVAAVVVLMIITSSGMFGYLTGAFQQALQPNKEVELELTATTKAVSELEASLAKVQSSKDQLALQVANVPAASVKSKQQLLAAFKPEQRRLESESTTLAEQLTVARSKASQLELLKAKHAVHTGPITYIADTFAVSQQQASKYVIMLLIFVFDPLAVMLVLAGNFLVKQRQEQLEQKPTSVQVASETSEPAVVSDETVFSIEPPIEQPEPALVEAPVEQPEPALVEDPVETAVEPVVPKAKVPAPLKEKVFDFGPRIRELHIEPHVEVKPIDPSIIPVELIDEELK
jgi:hypothetical protein